MKQLCYVSGQFFAEQMTALILSSSLSVAPCAAFLLRGVRLPRRHVNRGLMGGYYIRICIAETSMMSAFPALVEQDPVLSRDGPQPSSQRLSPLPSFDGRMLVISYMKPNKNHRIPHDAICDIHPRFGA